MNQEELYREILNLCNDYEDDIVLNYFSPQISCKAIRNHRYKYNPTFKSCNAETQNAADLNETSFLKLPLLSKESHTFLKQELTAKPIFHKLKHHNSERRKAFSKKLLKNVFMPNFLNETTKPVVELSALENIIVDDKISQDTNEFTVVSARVRNQLKSVKRVELRGIVSLKTKISGNSSSFLTLKEINIPEIIISVLLMWPSYIDCVFTIPCELKNTTFSKKPHILCNSEYHSRRILKFPKLRFKMPLSKSFDFVEFSAATQDVSWRKRIFKREFRARAISSIIERNTNIRSNSHHDGQDEDMAYPQDNKRPAMSDSIDTWLLLRGKKLKHGDDHRVNTKADVAVVNEEIKSADSFELLVGFSPNSSRYLTQDIKRVVANSKFVETCGNVVHNLTAITKIHVIQRDFVLNYRLIIISSSTAAVIMPLLKVTQDIESLMKQISNDLSDYFEQIVLIFSLPDDDLTFTFNPAVLKGIISLTVFDFSWLKVHYSFNDLHAATIIRKLVDTFADEEKSWLIEPESIHERFLCSLECFNPMSAQHILSLRPLKQILMDSPEELYELNSKSNEAISMNTFKKLNDIARNKVE